MEQQVVGWEPKEMVNACPFCDRNFGFTLRKHHCRICGRVICTDPNTQCTQMVVVDKPVKYRDPSATEKETVEVRMCKRCQQILLSSRLREHESESELKLVKTYQVM